MKEGVNPNKEKLLLILGRHLDLLWTESAIPGSYLPYDIVHEIQPNDWPTMTSEIVSGQLLAVINGINQFQTEINSLDAWARVLPDLSEAEAGSFTISHISSVGFFCLNQPYALKERIIHAATQIIHQGNRRTDRTYPDQLLTDAKSLAKFVWPKSSEKLKALGAVGRGRWKSFDTFLGTIASLNSKEFELETIHFRTNANHLIPPHLEVGEGPFVTRYMTAHSEMRANGDGTYQLVQEIDKIVPAYGFGGTPPLKIAKAVDHCVTQHIAAKNCYLALVAVIDEILATARIGAQ